MIKRANTKGVRSFGVADFGGEVKFFVYMGGEFDIIISQIIIRRNRYGK